jgi:putative ABC transport system permease protein
MIKNYVQTAIRSLRRQRGDAVINVLGLAIGLAGCLLVGLYVQDELSYDRHHAKADRIVRVAMDVVNDRTIEVTPTIVGPVFERTVPEVEESVRLYDIGRYNDVIVRSADRAFREERFFYADSTVFDVFTHPFVVGTPDDALTRPSTIVLTQSTAQRYFGDANPVGESLTVGTNRSFEVTGVIADPPLTSHVQFDFLASFVTTSWAQREIWMSANFYTYLLLQEGTAVAAVQDKVTALVDQRLGGDQQSFIRGLRLQPITEIHLYANGHITYVYFFVAIALLILGIAGINFTNLATAQSMDRAREVGVRKTLGAMRGGLIGQFLAEAVLLALGAALIAMALAEAALPAFQWLAGTPITQGVVGNPGAMGALLGVAVITGLAAGSYPAFVLARFHPAAVLKGTFQTSAQGRGVRKTLVTFQFAVSVALIASTTVVYQQLNYVQTVHLGFDKEQVVVLPLNDNAVYPALRQVLQQQPDVRYVTAVSAIPGEKPGGYTAIVPGRSEGERPSVAGIRADAGVVDALGLDLLAGSDLPSSETYDPQERGYAYLINEKLVRQLGWDNDEAPGKRFAVSGNREGTVVGVVADFHQASLHTAITPLVFFTEPGTYDNMLVKVNTTDVRATLAHIEATWQQVAPGMPFAHRFLDEAYDALYRAEMGTGRVFAAFSGLAILVACLGLFGLAAIAARQRTREIGIRKVLGASAGSLVVLLSKEFLVLVTVAFAVAAPLAYWGMQRWLADFAYRTDIGIGVFALAGCIALGGALLTVSAQAYRAATADPVDTLRTE